MSEGSSAELSFHYGVMNSGKSTTVLNRAHDFTERIDPVTFILAKPSIDTKGDRLITSRAGLQREVDFLITPDMDIQAEILRRSQEKYGGAALRSVMIDEAQFLAEDQVDGLFRLAVENGIRVDAYGIKNDFQSRLFSASRRLIELAHVIREMNPGICRVCGAHATLNARKHADEYVFDGKIVSIDGEEDVSYDALCGTHFLEKADDAGIVEVQGTLQQIIARSQKTQQPS